MPPAPSPPVTPQVVGVDYNIAGTVSLNVNIKAKVMYKKLMIIIRS